jgi:hypothetical protein
MENDPLYPVLVQAIAEFLITQRVNPTRLAAAIATALMGYLRPPSSDPDDPYPVHY